MATRKTIVGFKMGPTDGFFFEWKSEQYTLESFRPIVRAVRFGGAEYPIAEPTVACATFPRVDHGQDHYQGMVLGYAILALPDDAYEELSKRKEIPAEYALAFQGARGEAAREGIEYALTKRTPATAFFVAEIPAV